MRRKSITLLLIGSLILSLVGCSGQGTDGPAGPSQEIELIDPVSAPVSFEEAKTRNLYSASVYAATVVPYVEEYSPDYAFQFGYGTAFYGDEVKKGQELIKADTTAMDEQIKAQQEAIASMEEEYQKYVEKQQEEVRKHRERQDTFEYYVKMNEENEPAEFLDEADEDGNPLPNPAHVTWQQGYDYVTGEYRIAKHAADTIELQMKQRRELYELDRQHQQYLLKSMQNNRKRATVTSNMTGTVVAIRSLGNNQYLQADEPVIAVADTSRICLKCDYVNRNTIKNAEDVYAIIDGKRYEIEYQAISSDEYTRLSANGGKVYSTFEILDYGEEILVGDYALIAVISKRYENVVSVPRGAIQRGDGGNCVYLYENGKSVQTPVQTGFSDGVYTEIISGVQEGDKVLYAASTPPGGDNTVVLSKGEFHADYSSRATISYAFSTLQTNPVENGTVYYGEAQVHLFQHVNKGDVIATIRVEPDRLALSRNETRLARLKERLEDFRTQNKDDEKEEYFIETLKSYQEQIDDVEETIAKQKADFAVTRIVAEKSGVVTYLPEYQKEDILQKGAAVVEIADEGDCYVIVEDANQVLQYGNELQVRYVDAEQNEKSLTCKVVSMSRMGVSSELLRNLTYLQVPEEAIENVLQSMFAGDRWSMYRFTVEGAIRTMDDVLVVPRNAVYDEGGGKTYVYVKEKDGSVKAQQFVAGGNNDKYYWVVEGLTEGMEVCLK